MTGKPQGPGGKFLENERFSKTVFPKRRTQITMQRNNNAPSQQKFAVIKETSMVGEWSINCASTIRATTVLAFQMSTDSVWV